MARAGLTRSAIKRARDTLVAQRQYPSIDAIRIALGNTGSKTTIHRYLKELEEEKGTSLTRAAAAAALSSEQDAHAETRLALHQRDLDVERLTQQVRDQTARLAEQESFR
ncbi:DNA-binding protein [Pandoraea sp.]|uniref:DNA-binding protein n=1 Tax=Pandoraea sp. TaxID=1883445 RepID=UPI0025E3B894|nr:DNA-binding protein [Pandoraea sp.]